MQNFTIWAVASLVGAVLAMPAAVSAETFGADNLTTYGEIAWQESAKPVRPGVPGKAPFWNQHSKAFLYAPAFDFKAVEGASKYRFEIISDTTSETLAFDADVPYAPLSPVWPQVPVGGFGLTVTGLAEDGTSVGVSAEKKSYRAAPFNGPYHEPPEMPLDESATLALKKLLHKDTVSYWLEHKQPDPQYRLYRYPSKIMGALVIGAVTQARLTTGTEEGKRSEQLARIVADYLLSLRFPAGNAYEYHVPTYHGPHMAREKKKHMVLENHLTTMGVDAGNAFLDLYDLIGDEKYLTAAKQIADSFLKNQNSEGTWPLFVQWESGETATDLIAIPTAMINYFDRLRTQYKVTGYEEATKRALDYVMANPVKTFNWQGQFEDVYPRPPYVNQSREQACELAMYLMRNKGDMKLAEELIRFAEDQFVVWESPRPKYLAQPHHPAGYDSTNWITPCVQEQYVYWNPVSRSAGIMVDTFWEAYKNTGNAMYLAKAKSIANTFPEVQQYHDGEYATYFTAVKMNLWLNNSVYPAKVLMNLDNNLKNSQ